MIDTDAKAGANAVGAPPRYICGREVMLVRLAVAKRPEALQHGPLCAGLAGRKNATVPALGLPSVHQIVGGVFKSLIVIL